MRRIEAFYAPLRNVRNGSISEMGCRAETGRSPLDLTTDALKFGCGGLLNCNLSARLEAN